MSLGFKVFPDKRQIYEVLTSCERMVLIRGRWKVNRRCDGLHTTGGAISREVRIGYQA